MPNSPPAVAAIADWTVPTGATSTVHVLVTDADARDVHTLTSTSTDTVVATVSATGTRLILTGLEGGSTTIAVTATDDSGASNAASAPATFQVTVPNSRPAVGAMADRTVSNGVVHTVTVPVSDADAGDAHTLSASSDDTSVASVTTAGRYAYPRGVGRE